VSGGGNSIAGMQIRKPPCVIDRVDSDIGGIESTTHLVDTSLLTTLGRLMESPEARMRYGSRRGCRLYRRVGRWTARNYDLRSCSVVLVTVPVITLLFQRAFSAGWKARQSDACGYVPLPLGRCR